MNNKGFGIAHIFGFGIFTVAVIFVIYTLLTSTNTIFVGNKKYRNSKNVYKKYVEKTAIEDNQITYTSYEDMEDDINKAMKDYIYIFNIKLAEDDSLTKGIVFLQEKKLLKDIKDIENNSVYCTGYVKAIYKNSLENDYKSFIKCGNNYITEGYDNSNIEK